MGPVKGCPLQDPLLEATRCLLLGQWAGKMVQGTVECRVVVRGNSIDRNAAPQGVLQATCSVKNGGTEQGL